MVEVAGERVAAPTLSRSVDRSLGTRAPAAGRGRRLAEVAPGDPGAAILDDMAARWQEIDAVSLAHYVNSQADSDAWEALTAGPPIQRGFGGLELVGKGRPGGGEAAGVGSAGAKSRYAENKETKGTKTGLAEGSPRPAVPVPPRGSLQIGAPKGGGAGDRDHWAEVARGGRSALRRCWERGAAEAGGAPLTLEVTIDRRGGVRDARISGAPAAAGELRRCLEEAAKGWRYAAPSGGGEATVRYPLRYEPA